MKILRTTTAVVGFAAVVFAGAIAVAPAQAADALGTWFTGDKESQVRIVNCGGALCGSLVWLKEPNDPATGRPKTDKNNADANKQKRPLLGIPIVLGMKPTGPGQWSGEVYNASDGKTYSGSFTLTSGVLSQEPMQGSTSISMVNAGVEGFVRAAALELPRGIRINVVGPPWVTETLIAL